MKIVLIISLLALLCVPAIAGDSVSIDATDMPIKQALDSIAQQSGVQILLDGEVEGKMTATMSNVPAEDAIKTVAKYAGWNWRRMDLVVGPDTKVSVAKLKSAISALDALELAGLSVADPKTGKVSLVAKSLGADAKSGLKLPEGQKWKAYFLITKPEVKKAEDKPKDSAAAQASQEATERLNKITSMEPEQRQAFFQNEFASELQLAPETRVQIWKDRLAVFGNLMQDPTTRDQLRADMRDAFSQLRPQGQGGP